MERRRTTASRREREFNLASDVLFGGVREIEPPESFTRLEEGDCVTLNVTLESTESVIQAFLECVAHKTKHGLDPGSPQFSFFGQLSRKYGRTLVNSIVPSARTCAAVMMAIKDTENAGKSIGLFYEEIATLDIMCQKGNVSRIAPVVLGIKGVKSLSLEGKPTTIVGTDGTLSWVEIPYSQTGDRIERLAIDGIVMHSRKRVKEIKADFLNLDS